MEFYDEKIKALAIEIYELDAEVYKKLGSSLGRVFGGEKDICIRNIMEDLHSRQNSSRIRSELALISNMARTIPDHDTRHDIMVRYNNIVEEIAELPTGFADGDILDQCVRVHLQAQVLLQGRILRMGGQVLRQQETQRLQRLRRHLPAQALQIRHPGGIVGGLYRLRPAAVPLTTGNHKQ